MDGLFASRTANMAAILVGSWPCQWNLEDSSEIVNPPRLFFEIY